MNIDLSQYQKISKTYTIVKDNIIIEEFSQYPLILAVPSHKIPTQDIISKADTPIKEYIDYALKQISKHKKFAFSEESIIESLNSNKDFARKLALKIHSELAFIRQEKPEFLREFTYTQKFLAQHEIDIFANSITKDTL